MSDPENENDTDPVEEAAKKEAEERKAAEEKAKAQAKESETPKEDVPLRKTPRGPGKGLSLAKKRK